MYNTLQCTDMGQFISDVYLQNVLSSNVHLLGIISVWQSVVTAHRVYAIMCCDILVTMEQQLDIYECCTVI